MMDTIRRIRYSVAIAAGALPMFAYAQSSGRPLTFDRVVGIAYGLVQFLFLAAFWIAAIMIAWFGLQMILSGQNPERFTSAKRGLMYTVIGFAVAIGANLIVLALRRAVAGL